MQNIAQAVEKPSSLRWIWRESASKSLCIIARDWRDKDAGSQPDPTVRSTVSLAPQIAGPDDSAITGTGWTELVRKDAAGTGAGGDSVPSAAVTLRS